MSKIITLSGASGVGKTTLAKWISEEYGIPFVELSTKPIWKAWGIQSHKELIQKTILDPTWGVRFQDAVLEMRLEAFTKGGSMVCDRGSWDAWVYFLMQVAPFIGYEETQAYLENCIKLNKYITHSIFIRHLQGIVEDDGKRITNPYYQESFDILMAASGDHFSKYNTQEICVWDFEQRKEIVRRYLGYV